MIPHQRRMNPFIQRMADDMKIRNFADTTIDAYTWHVDKFCQHFGKPADELGPEQIRSFELYLVNDKKVSWSSFNQAVCGLRFLYQVTLAQPWTVQHIPYGKRPKKLPMVLSDQEAAKLLECVEHPKHRAVLTTCYAAGMRLSTMAVITVRSGKTSCRHAVNFFQSHHWNWPMILWSRPDPKVKRAIHRCPSVRCARPKWFAYAPNHVPVGGTCLMAAVTPVTRWSYPSTESDVTTFRTISPMPVTPNKKSKSTWQVHSVQLASPPNPGHGGPTTVLRPAHDSRDFARTDGIIQCTSIRETISNSVAPRTWNPI